MREYYSSYELELIPEKDKDAKALMDFALAFDRWETAHFRAMKRLEKISYGRFLDNGGFKDQDAAGDLAVKRWNNLIKLGLRTGEKVKDISELDTVTTRLMVQGRLESKNSI
jgi:hypothetical protein